MNYSDFERKNYKAIFIISILKCFKFQSMKLHLQIWLLKVQSEITCRLQSYSDTPRSHNHHISLCMISLFLYHSSLLDHCYMYYRENYYLHKVAHIFHQSSLSYMYRIQILYHKKMLLSYYTCMCFDNCRRKYCWYMSSNIYCIKKEIILT